MILTIYAIFLIIIALLFWLIAYNFIRYRFKGDKTYPILIIFAIATIATVVTSLTLYAGTGSLQPSQPLNPFESF